MRMIAFILFLSLLIGLGLWYGVFLRCQDDWCLVTERQKEGAADSFERCQELGFPVMESYPRQCRAGERVFTEKIGERKVLEPIATDSILMPSTAALIRVTQPSPNQVVRSPFVVRGEARGTWYFEASFPVRLLDANGRELTAVPAQAQGEWMTENFVPFEAKLEFEMPATATGTLVLQKDNPSGLPEQAAEIRIPLRFNQVTASEQIVKLYFYDQNADTGADGMVACSQESVTPVERTIPRTLTPIQDTLRLLLAGGLTAEERARGLSTEFPLPGVSLAGASLSNGVLTLSFADPQNKTSGGACRVGILRAQIEKTAKQFPEVKEIRIRPEESFQP